jgi:serine/threonine protein kinase
MDDTWMYYGFGISFVVVGIVAAIAIVNQKKGKVTARHEASDMIGGYRLKKLMMTGQSSQVWEAVEEASGRHFAIKHLLPEKLVETEHRRMLCHEARVGMLLSHPNVIRILKLVDDKTNPYFIMEYFGAKNLKLRLMTMSTRGSQKQREEADKEVAYIKEKAHGIFKQAATGLAYMHASGWVHRDVKPDNIMVNNAGEVRLIDFALAQRISRRGLFRRKRGRSAGTRTYMSPEQIRGQPLDGRADIYSFGISAYEIVTGRPPFRAATPTELLNKHMLEKPASPQHYNPDVTDQFAALVLKMIAKKKEERPRDFHEVLMALREMRVFKSEVLQKSPET